MAFISSYLILLLTTALLSFRLTRSYQLSFISIISSYLFAAPLLSVLDQASRHQLIAFSVLSIGLYTPLHKVLAKFVARQNEAAESYPIIFVSGFFVVQIFASAVVYFVPSLNLPYSLTQTQPKQWLMLAGSMLCAFNVYHDRGTHRILIAGSSILVSSTLYSLLLEQPFSSPTLVGMAGPWCWLILMRTTDGKRWISRLLITLVIASTPLLQLTAAPALSYLVGLPIIVAGIVCLGDILRCTNTQSILIAAIPITAVIAALSALVVQLSFR